MEIDIQNQGAIIPNIVSKIELRNIAFAGLLGASALGLGACSIDKAQANQKPAETTTTTAATSPDQAIKDDLNNELSKLEPIIIGGAITVGVLGLGIGLGTFDQNRRHQETKYKTLYEDREYRRKRRQDS